MTNGRIVWVSSVEKSRWKRSRPRAAREAEADLAVTRRGHQVVEGVGGCFNELGWIALRNLAPGARRAVLDDLFRPGKGCNFNYCRMPVGASDYGASWYSLNETDGDYAMRRFSIARDKTCLIPYIKEALRRRPDLTLFASPWSPPSWMKSPKVFNYGKLRREERVLKAYALYFLKLVREYRRAGVRIHQIHPQNEPVADQKFPSCLWTGAELRDFIRDYLGPLFRKEKEPCEIWLGTLNTDNYEDYPLTVLSDASARRYISGVAFQWWGKHVIQKTHAAWPRVKLIQSENECGDGRNTWDYAHYVFNLVHHYFTNGVSAYVYWNMVLPTGGESTWGWKQNSMICIDPSSGKAVYNPEFFVMEHLSHFLRPGAIRLELEGPWSGNALAFRNPDGGCVVVASNPLAERRRVTLDLGEGRLRLDLERKSFNTVFAPG